MARAKQTTRADARRRHRQALAQSTAEIELLESGDEGADEPRRPRGSAADRNATPQKSAAAPGGGLGAAFRGAYHPANYREDLAAMPTLLRGRWFLISAALVVVGFVGAVAAPNSATLFVFQTLTLPPAMVPIFLVGFTAPRASYMLGLVVGIVDVVLYSVFVVFVTPPTNPPVPMGEFLISGLTVGLPASVLFSSAAAWYRRFLALSSPRRQQAASSRGKRSGKGSNRR